MLTFVIFMLVIAAMGAGFLYVVTRQHRNHEQEVMRMAFTYEALEQGVRELEESYGMQLLDAEDNIKFLVQKVDQLNSDITTLKSEVFIHRTRCIPALQEIRDGVSVLDTTESGSFYTS